MSSNFVGMAMDIYFKVRDTFLVIWMAVSLVDNDLTRFLAVFIEKTPVFEFWNLIGWTKKCSVSWDHVH